jgi:hypothetical protein
MTCPFSGYPSKPLLSTYIRLHSASAPKDGPWAYFALRFAFRLAQNRLTPANMSMASTTIM